MVKNLLYIHNEKRVRYGAQYINDLIVKKLRIKGVWVDSVFPEESLNLAPQEMSGISNILFFYSLIGKKKDIKKYDIIQGTTYTPLAFLNNGVPVVSHFGSTTAGFLESVPSIKQLERENPELLEIFNNLKDLGIITKKKEHLKPLKDIAKIEIHVAKNSDAVIATSKKVKKELVKRKVREDKIHIIHNAIEDYWFKTRINKNPNKSAGIVYLGRIGDDPFTIRLKGVNRLLYILRRFPQSNKKVIAMCHKTELYHALFCGIPKTESFLSVEKKKIPALLKNHFADIYVNTGRYEGFGLSIVEAMSQGLIPLVFPIGVVPEMIKNGYNGYIVHSMSEMLNVINELKSKPAKRKILAENSIKTSKQFKADILVKEYIKLYKKLLAEKKEKAQKKTQNKRE